MQLTFGLKRIEDVIRHIYEMCPMDKSFQVTDEFRELNANLITCIKHLEQYWITFKMLMQLYETKKLEEEEKASIHISLTKWQPVWQRYHIT